MIVPIHGWLLDRAVEIDATHPGFAGHLFRASCERRHVVAAYLSRNQGSDCPQEMAAVGEFLMSAGHDDILRAAYGPIPPGLRGAISRGAKKVWPRRHYNYVYLVMSTELRPSMRRLMLNLRRVDPIKLMIARVLPDDLKIETLVMSLRSVGMARDLVRLVRLLGEAGVEREVLALALRSVRDERGIREFAKRWAFRARLPTHPVPPDNDFYCPVAEASDLLSLARRFRNCARSYLSNALEGRSAFAVVADGTHEGVVHLVKDPGGWRLDDVYGPENRSPNRNLTARAIAYLETWNVTARSVSRSHEWDCLRRLAGHFDFEVGWDGLEVG